MNGKLTLDFGMRCPDCYSTHHCEANTPPCARCHHAFDAHDPDSPYNGACLVGGHEDATGPECECPEYIDPEALEWGVVYSVDGVVRTTMPGTYANCREQYDALIVGWSEVYLVRIIEGRGC
jgi:hypothetical protein